jgi:hypothetical protein
MPNGPTGAEPAVATCTGLAKDSEPIQPFKLNDSGGAGLKKTPAYQR